MQERKTLSVLALTVRLLAVRSLQLRLWVLTQPSSYEHPMTTANLNWAKGALSEPQELRDLPILVCYPSRLQQLHFEGAQPVIQAEPGALQALQGLQALQAGSQALLFGSFDCLIEASVERWKKAVPWMCWLALFRQEPRWRGRHVPDAWE